MYVHTKCPISMYIFYGTVTQNLKGPHYMAIHHQHVCTLSDLVQLQLLLCVYCAIYAAYIVPCQSFQCTGFNFMYVRTYSRAVPLLCSYQAWAWASFRQMNDTLVLSRLCGMWEFDCYQHNHHGRRPCTTVTYVALDTRAHELLHGIANDLNWNGADNGGRMY